MDTLEMLTLDGSYWRTSPEPLNPWDGKHAKPSMIRICVDADGPGIIFPVMHSERIMDPIDPTICLREMQNNAGLFHLNYFLNLLDPVRS